jgi:hypothetical protein
MLWSVVIPTGLLAFVSALLIALFLFAPFPRTMVYGCLVESLLIMAATLVWASVASGSFFMWAVTGVSLAGILYYITIAWYVVLCGRRFRYIRAFVCSFLLRILQPQF